MTLRSLALSTPKALLLSCVFVTAGLYFYVHTGQGSDHPLNLVGSGLLGTGDLSNNNMADARVQAKEFVDSTIANNPVVIFSKTYCPYCIKAKAVGGVGLVDGCRGRA